MSERDTELKLGRDNLDRMARLGIPFFQNDDPRQVRDFQDYGRNYLLSARYRF